MAAWSGIRNKLEWIDGKEIFKGVIWGGFDNHSFYQAFAEFDNQSIETSLESRNLLVHLYERKEMDDTRRSFLSFTPKSMLLMPIVLIAKGLVQVLLLFL